MLFIHLSESSAFAGQNFASQVCDVFADVAIGGHLGFLTLGLHIPGEIGPVESVHLGAGVIDVVLSGHTKARCVHDAGQSAAQDGAPGVTNVDRPGGIYADELNHHFLTVAHGHAAETHPGLPDRFHLLLNPTVPEVEVDEARRGYHHSFHLFPRLNPVGELLGQFQRVDTGGAGQSQGKIGSKVTVLRVAGALHHDVRHGIQLNQSVGSGLLQGIGHQLRY